MVRVRTLLPMFCMLIVLVSTEQTHGQFVFKEQPVQEIIREIQAETDWRFLYREALVTDIRLSFETERENLIESLREKLEPHKLSVRVDSAHNQAIIVKQSGGSLELPKKQSIIRISGQVVDELTGERLPFATISWQNNGQTQGVSANSSGKFQLNRRSTDPKIILTCSYVGYQGETVQFDVSKNKKLEEVTFRLKPKRIDGNELVVTGTNYYGQIDENTAGLVDIGMFSPMGGTNSVRALQSLPSTSLTPALNGDMHVRGSPADGFRVLLDGITIFNQTHLFGLLDSFNSDVLQRSNFFYDIAPAQYQAPPGGTLSMVTKTGSLNEFSANPGASNTSYRLTLEGPLNQGSSSWLISGRGSYLNSVNWLNNSNLIQWGLNVNRPREVLDPDLVNIESQLVSPGMTSAHFLDLHGKLYFEGQNSSRFIISGYYGQDNTEQEADRQVRSFDSSNQNFELRKVSTTNDWSNGAVSLQYQDQLSEQVFSQTTAGVSIYRSDFSKDDFTYTRVNRENGTFQLFVFPFENRSILNELKAEQQFDFNYDPWLISAGLLYQYYLGEYYEDSFDRPGFLTNRTSHKTDLYANIDYSGWDWLDLSAGARMYYYTNGEYLRWSPRLKLRLFPQSPISIGGGFSRNYQFLNKISLSNTVTSDVWILSNNTQPPNEVDYYSVGIYLEPTNWLYAQLEGYYKDFSNVRLHEINALSLTNTFNDAPWYANNNGIGQGIELLVRNRVGRINLSQTFTISEMQLSNPAINNGEPFYVDWDRKFRYGATLESEPLNHVFLYLSWMYATGAPNKLATFGAGNDERLGNYQRTDITIEYKNRLSFGKLQASVSVFNLFDRQNPWYRDLAFVKDQSTNRSRIRTVPVNVYDIGMQPSFNLSLSF